MKGFYLRVVLLLVNACLTSADNDPVYEELDAVPSDLTDVAEIDGNNITLHLKDNSKTKRLEFAVPSPQYREPDFEINARVYGECRLLRNCIMWNENRTTTVVPCNQTDVSFSMTGKIAGHWGYPFGNGENWFEVHEYTYFPETDVTDDNRVIEVLYNSSRKVNLKFFASRGEVRVTTDLNASWCNDIKQLESWPFGKTRRRYRPMFLASFLGNDCGIDIEVVNATLLQRVYPEAPSSLATTRWTSVTAKPINVALVGITILLARLAS